MAEPARTPAVCRFGVFQLDLNRHEIFRAGVKVRLQKKPFSVLLMLISKAGEIVSREDLRHALWADDTYVEFDEGLNSAVKKLRIALGDSPENPRFVETIPRRGYRFIAPVTVEVVPPEEPRTIPGEAQRAARQKPWIAWASAAAVLVLITGTMIALRFNSSTAKTITSVAVLPLESLSSAPEQGYFADGITDELITDLARIGPLRVISRSSVMHFKGTRKSIPEIAKELNVDAVVEGSISTSADRIRVRAQLIQVGPERHIWAETYERPVSDTVQLQEELAGDIADAIRVRLTKEQRASLGRSRDVSPEAHALYLQGRYFWNKRTAEGYRKAAALFQQAIAKDPQYAAAYAGLADTYAFQAEELTPQVSLAKTKEFAERALQIDPNLAEAHATVGLIAPHFGWDWQDAQRHFERAIQLDPNYATAHQWYAEVYFATMGRMDDAIAEMRKAQQLDPLSPIMSADLGKMLYYARRYDEAIVELQHALELDPDFPVAHWFLLCSYVQKKDYMQAYAEIRSKNGAKEPGNDFALAYIDAHAGRREQARKHLARVIEYEKHTWFDPAAIAAVYVALNDEDEAFRWLRRGLETEAATMNAIKVSPDWDPIRKQPEFQVILQQLHLS